MCKEKYNNQFKTTIRASVAMAVWNGERYINEQIGSVVEMMEDTDELVISYERSEDKTWEIIKDYERIDRRIKIVNDSGNSVEHNFNNAVENCSGKFIFLADQDDVWINNKINKMVSIFEEDESIKVLISDGYITDSELRKKGTLFDTYHTSTNPIRNVIKGTYLGCQMAFRSDIKNMIWPVSVSPPLPHDLYLGIRAWRYGRVSLLKDKLILHRMHGNNYSNNSKLKLLPLIDNRIRLVRAVIKS